MSEFPSDDPQSGNSLCNLVLDTVSLSDIASTLEALRSANICSLTALRNIVIDPPAWIALRLPNNNVRARLQAATMDAVGMETAVVAGNATVPPLLAVPVAALVAATVADTDCDGGALARCCRVGHDSEHCRGHRTKVAPLLWRTGGKVFCFGVWTPPPGGDTHDPMAEAIALYERKERIRKARAKRRRHEAATSQQPLFIVNKEGNEPSTVARTRQRQDHSEHTAPSEEWTAWLK